MEVLTNNDLHAICHDFDLAQFSWQARIQNVMRSALSVLLSQSYLKILHYKVLQDACHFYT